jgi:hypothetical protein
MTPALSASSNGATASTKAASVVMGDTVCSGRQYACALSCRYAGTEKSAYAPGALS